MSDELELGYPGSDTLGGMEDDWRAGVAMMHAELVELSLWRIRREMMSDPGALKVQIGAGFPAEQSFTGNQRDPFNGMIVYNPTPATVSVGFQTGTGLLAPATVPPFSWASFPERYVNLSVALNNPADAQQAIANPVTILRTKVPPAPGAGAFGASAPQQPLVSLPAGSSALAAGVALDNGFPRATHSVIANAAAGTTAGQVSLFLSHDGVNWAQAVQAAAFTAPGSVIASVTAPARYARAQITTAMVGGTVSATVASA